MRRFGVEMEFCGNPPTFADALSDHGVSVEMEDYNHTNRPWWKIVEDGSVNAGAELVSPILGRPGRHEPYEVTLERVTNAAADAGCTVDRSTGLHVHYDARDVEPDTLVRMLCAYIDNQTSIDALLAPSRRSTYENGYAAPWTSRERMRLVDGWDAGSLTSTRYRTINPQSLRTHGTIEVRQHQGTLYAPKAIAWVRFGHALFGWAASEPAIPPSFDGTVQMLDFLSDRMGELPSGRKVSAYLYARMRKLSGARSSAKESIDYADEAKDVAKDAGLPESRFIERISPYIEDMEDTNSDDQPYDDGQQTCDFEPSTCACDRDYCGCCSDHHLHNGPHCACRS